MTRAFALAALAATSVAASEDRCLASETKASAAAVAPAVPPAPERPIFVATPALAQPAPERPILGATPAVQPAAAVKAVPEAAVEDDIGVTEARRRTGTFLVGSGFAMLAASVGMALFSGTQGAPGTSARNALTSAAPSGPRPAGIAAIALAASGAGALVAGGLVLALAPDGVALQSRF